jgi:hypothetical protein
MLLLALGAFVSSEIRSEVASPAASTSYWRRAANGWEDRRTWTLPARSWHPPLHPAVVAGLQIGGVMSLLALAGTERRRTS